MQTFLPYPSFSLSANVLDYRRLGKQRVECKQILKALGYEIRDERLVDVSEIPAAKLTKAGWSNHPATKMWRGYEMALADYMTIMVMEWERRGYNNTMPKLNISDARLFQNPPWLGDEAFHASHRSNLLRKDPVHYGQFGWKETPDLEYVWPTVPDKGPERSTSF